MTGLARSIAHGTGVIFGLVLAPSTGAVAQRGLNRALIWRRGEAPVTIPATRKAALPDSLVRLSAKWVVHPFGSGAPAYAQGGVLVGLQNTNRFGPNPWRLDIGGTERWIGGRPHRGWQTDAEYDPAAPRLGKVALLAALTAQYAIPSPGQGSVELAGAADIALSHAATSTLGVIEFFDWSALSSTDGLTTGLTASQQVKARLSLVAEYDFPSRFTGAYSYSFGASLFVATAGKTEISIRSGWARGNVGSVGLQIGVPSETRVRRSQLRPKR